MKLKNYLNEGQIEQFLNKNFKGVINTIEKKEKYTIYLDFDKNMDFDEQESMFMEVWDELSKKFGSKYNISGVRVHWYIELEEK